eukprot:XP_019078739.1 PREDICTED: uncharacterized protein LOC100256524 isoform X2 [Vitis vinifera]
MEDLMDNDKLYSSIKMTEADGDCSLVFELPENDPLFEKKKKVLQAKGFDTKERVYFNSISCSSWTNTTLEKMLKRARIIHLDEVELYFGEVPVSPSVEFYSHRNELEALNSILSLIDISCSSCQHTRMDVLQELCNATLDRIQEVGDKNRLETRIVEDLSIEKEECILQWGERNDVRTKLKIAYVEGAGRGAIATEDLKVGDVALEIPMSIVISEELVHESDMGSLRSKRDSISGEVDMATKNPIFTSVISRSPTITSEKLIGSENYLSWSAFVELWFMGQGYEDHLVTPEDAIPDVDKVQWKKIDAQLCSVLWQSVDPKILHHLRAYKTCFKFWTQAKGLYTNDIQRFYKVVYDIVHVRQQDMDLSTYIGWIASLKEEFLTLMPFTNGVEAQQIQTDKFFMVLTLIGLRPDLEYVRDQILASSSVPSLDDVFARLLRLSSTQTLSTDGPSDSSVLASQTNSRGGRSGNRGRRQRPQCTYCNKLGHTQDCCYQLHGRPPRTAHIAQSFDPLLSRPDSVASSTSQSITLTGSDYDAYLRYQATTSASVTSVAQTGNVSVYFTQSPSLDPWILDSGASDHISGPEYGEDDWHRA